jgi:hypothetical protein
MPDLDEQLFVVFIEPADQGSNLVFVQEKAEAVAAAASRYPNDEIICLPPFAPAPPSPVPSPVIDAILADLAELVSPADYQSITDTTLLHSLFRAALNFVGAKTFDKDQLLVAEIVGAPFAFAEISVVASPEKIAGFSLYPGRGAFEKMRQWRLDAPLRFDELYTMGMHDLPDWAASAARGVCNEISIPKPIHVLRDARIPITNEDVLILIAVTNALASPRIEQTGNVRVRIEDWLP